MRFVLGPWPVRPLLTAVFFSLIEEIGWIALAVQGSDTIPFRPMVSALPWSLLSGIVLAGSLWAVNRVLHGIPVSALPGPTMWWERGRYLLILLLAVIVLIFIHEVTGLPSTVSGPQLAFRAFVAALVVAATFGAASDRLSRQVLLTQEARDLVAEQRQQLLEVDEKARREVATYLHDSVQADLVVLSMQLRSLATSMPTEIGEPVRSVIDELEALRLLDIRAASRRLSPDLAALGLGGTLQELASGYAPAMQVTVVCEGGTAARSDEVALGLYRIVEQALLNAAVHANADEVSISIAQRSGTGSGLGRSSLRNAELIEVTVTNNGTPMSPTTVRGAGSAVIEAWVSRFNGSWWMDSLGVRTRMNATLRIPD